MHPWMKTEAHHARLKTHAAISCLEHYMDTVSSFSLDNVHFEVT